MEILYFTITAIVLYILADRILVWIEDYLGRQLENRSLVFFGLLLVMAMSSFAIIRSVLG